MRDPIARLDEWRRQGADRIDPVRFRFVEALARRATLHGGATRRMLDERLAQWLADYDDKAGKAGAATVADPASTTTAAEASTPLAANHANAGSVGLGPLGQLVEEIAASTVRPAGAAEPPALRYFRDTWSRLSADRRLTQSLAQLPENAGPLNSQQLVHRALTLMRELSPDYLHRFMSTVDTLSWLERTQAANAASTARATQAAKATRRASTRKSARDKGPQA